MTKLEQYKIKDQEFWKYVKSDKCNSRRLDKMIKELESLAIEINKENNCYYDNETWITKLNIFNHPTLTGNELTNYIANELNKLNGVILEKEVEDDKVNYIVYVITPYYIYHYKLYRGYNNQVNFTPYKFSNETNKSYSHKIVVENDNLIELIFGKNIIKRNFLLKDKNAKFELNNNVIEEEVYVDPCPDFTIDDLFREWNGE